MQKGFKEVMALLGAMLAAPSIISLIQHFFAVGLVGYFADFVTFYRALVEPVFTVLYWPARALIAAMDWPLVIPAWLQDLHALSFAGAALFTRALVAAEAHENKTYNALAFAIFTFGFGVTLLGLFLLIGIAQAMTSRPEKQNNPPLWRQVRLFGWATTFGVVAFYVANATALV